MIRKLYARFWLWKNGYCKHGARWLVTPVASMWCLKSLPCRECVAESNHREDIRAQKKEQKKDRMLEAL